MRSKSIKRGVAVLAGTATAFTLAGAISFQPIASVAATSTTSSNTVATYDYESQYDSFDDVLQAGSELNLELAAEGFVLLKNQTESDGTSALPLAKSERKVTVLGTAAGNLSTGGGGTGGQSKPGGTASKVATDEASDIYDALDEAGITYNPRVKNIYDNLGTTTATVSGDNNFSSTSNIEGGHYMNQVEKSQSVVQFGDRYYANEQNSTLASATNTFSTYGDAAIIVVSRTGSEGTDNLANNVTGHSDESEHYLELDDAERELVAYAKLNFKKIIFVVNSPSVMELGDLQDDDAISAILWIGQPGWNGVLALGGILTGDINPSGKTVDYYMRDFTQDPTWYNFGDYSQLNYVESRNDYVANAALADGDTASYKMAFDAGTVSQKNSTENAVDYAEGIYVGYRYYETMYEEIKAAKGKDAAEEWYSEHTVYEFGYGLSYTTFSQKITKVDGDISKADGTLTVSVEVTNTGTVAGKDVVELYNTAPYTAGGIDKAAIALVGFTKTDSLKPGAKQTVQITIDVKDLASFDYNDANDNGFSGYELEAGDYVLSIRSDSHTVLDSKTLTLSKGLTWDGDDDESTPNAIYSQTTDSDYSKWASYNTLADVWVYGNEEKYVKNNHYLTRDDLVDDDGDPFDVTDLAWIAIKENGSQKLFTLEALNVLNSRVDNGSDGNNYKDYDNNMTTTVETDYQNLWLKTASDMEGKTQGSTSTSYTLYDMKGLAYDADEWEDYLNQYTYAQLIETFTEGNYGNQAVEEQGKPVQSDLDGPGQLSSGWAWVCEVVIASTWNTDLAYQEGVIVGNESMWQNVNGWYGPAMDTHRNPLAGRNFEYYSQDGVQGGLIGAAVVSGAVSQGCHVYLKHIFMNDQETNRISTATFATEQAIREIYARSFEIAVKKGGTNGLMLAFNLIGISGSASYATSIQLFQNEWGYTGFTVTDAHVVSNDQTGWNSYQMIRGLTMPLGSLTRTGLGRWETQNGVTGVYVKGTQNGKTNDTLSYTQWYWVRELAHRILYNNANNNGILSGTGGNGYAATLLTESVGSSTTIDMTVGTAKDVVLDLTKLNTIFGGTGYKLTASGLPAGLTLSNGKITGTPTAGGTYNATLNLVGNSGLGYITASTTITFNITTDKLKVKDASDTEITTATYNTTLDAKVSQSFIDLSASGVKYDPTAKAEKANVGTYTSATLTAEGLPYGLTLGAYDKTTNTATLTGSAKATGTFDVTFTFTVGQIASREMTRDEMMASMGGGGGMPGGDDVNGDGGKSGSTKYDQNTDDPDLSTNTSTGNGQGQNQNQNQNRDPSSEDGETPMQPGQMNTTTYAVVYTSYSAVVTIKVEAAQGTTVNNINFNANGGTSAVTKIGTTSTGTATLTSAQLSDVKPSRAGGYTFLGWATTADATTATIAADATTATVQLTDKQNEETTLYAVWQMPSIALVNGEWYVNGEATGLYAAGTAGTNGTDGSDGAEGVGIVSVTTTDVEGGTEVTIILSDGSSTTFTVDKGDKGDKGDTGSVGETGKTGDTGAAGESGSGVAGLVIGIIALVVALGAAAVVVVILLKKKN